MRCPKLHPGPFFPIEIGTVDPDVEEGVYLQCRFPVEDGFCDERFLIPEVGECCGFDTVHDSQKGKGPC